MKTLRKSRGYFDSIAAQMTRRNFIALSSGTIAGICLPGCGGGGGNSGGGSPVTPPVTGPSLPRPQPTGDLAAQLTQYSKAADTLSQTWMGSSQAVSNLQTFLANRSVGASRDASSTAAEFIQCTAFSLNALQVIYERIANSIVSLDDLTYLGDTTARFNSGLVEISVVSNPQWGAAMIQRSYLALRAVSVLMSIQQSQGIAQISTFVQSQTDSTQRLVAYAILASLFNEWINRAAGAIGVPVNPNWQLNVSANMTVDQVPQQLSAISGILASLPFGPGYRPTFSFARDVGSTSDTSLFDEARNIFNSFVGTMGEMFVNVSNKVVLSQWAANPVLTAQYIKSALQRPLFQTVLLTKLASEIGKDIFIDKIIAPLLTPFVGAMDAAAVANAIKIANDIYSLSTDIASIILTSESVVGPLVYGYQALNAYADLIKDLNNAKILLTAAQQQALQDATALDGNGSMGGSQVPGRTLPAATNPAGAESDQFWQSLGEHVIKTSISIPPTDTRGTRAGGPTVGSLMPADARAILLGNGGGGAPRSFNNVAIAAASLLYDIGNRNPDTVKATLSGDTLQFYGVDLPLLIRRVAGDQSVVVPAITNAQLLCTSPGFIPMKSVSPVDLTLPGASLQALNPITPLGIGVGINVK